MTEVLLKELTKSDIDWMVAIGHQREIAAGTTLIQPGKAADFLHIFIRWYIQRYYPATRR